MTAADLAVTVEGREIRLTTPDRVLWPATGTTKAALTRYYVQVAPVLLPHLRDRPLTLHRYPEGIDGPHFYQTRCPPRPDWVRVQRMYTFRRSGKEVDAPVIDDLPGLVWAANLATIELHPFLATTDDLDRPTVVVFDLDPGAPAGLADACSVAVELRAVLDALSLRSFAKTSGLKGLHVYVPIGRSATFDETKPFAHAVAELLAGRLPDVVVTTMARRARVGKVLVDWSQNDAGKSTVAPYSLRGATVPTASVPVTWEEVESAAWSGKSAPLVMGGVDVVERVDAMGDLFAPVLELEQRLPATAGS